jgi:hypothetical protein
MKLPKEDLDQLIRTGWQGEPVRASSQAGIGPNCIGPVIYSLRLLQPGRLHNQPRRTAEADRPARAAEAAALQVDGRQQKAVIVRTGPSRKSKS